MVAQKNRRRRNRRNRRRQKNSMNGGAVELNEVEVNNSGCSTANECSTQQIEKQAAGAEKQIEMRNQAGGDSQKVTAQVVEGSTGEDAALQEQIQLTAYQGQAQAEFDKNAGTSGGRRKRRKSKRRKSKRRKSKRRKSKRRKSKRRKSKRRKRRKSKRRKSRRK